MAAERAISDGEHDDKRRNSVSADAAKTAELGEQSEGSLTRRATKGALMLPVYRDILWMYGGNHVTWCWPCAYVESQDIDYGNRWYWNSHTKNVA